MKTQQGGFTLIELVVVIVILGILAAVATPRFANISAQAETATCQGVVGALSSAAVVQLAANTGVAQTRAVIVANTDVAGGTPTPTIDATGGGTPGVIDVTVGTTTCSTPDLLAAGLSAD